MVEAAEEEVWAQVARSTSREVDSPLRTPHSTSTGHLEEMAPSALYFSVAVVAAADWEVTAGRRFTEPWVATAAADRAEMALAAVAAPQQAAVVVERLGMESWAVP